MEILNKSGYHGLEEELCHDRWHDESERLTVLKNNYDSWEALFNETQIPHLLEAGVPEDDIKGFMVFKVSPPITCQYFQHQTAMIPIIVKGQKTT